MKVKDRRFQATDDETGVAPKEDFKITCGACFRNAIIQYMNEFKEFDGVVLACGDLRAGKFDMFLRQSSLGSNTNISDRAFANNLFYKCNTCDSQKLFGVPISSGYYYTLKNRRKGKNVFTPIEAWMKDKDKRKQLKSLGYI